MSICDCDPDALPSLHAERWVKARNPHQCCECDNTIPIGETYVYAWGVWEGDPQSWHMCERCNDLMASLSAAGYCVSYGELLEDYREYRDDYSISLHGR